MNLESSGVSPDRAPWAIEPLHLPESLDSPDAADFIAANDLSNLTEGLRWGNNDHWVSAENALAGAQSSRYTARQGFIATVDDRVVGRAVVEAPLTDNTGCGYVHVIVHPEYQRRGLGSQLYAVLEDHLRGKDRRIVMAWSDHPADLDADADAGDADAADGLRPASGPGSLRQDDGVARYCLGLGYRLEQIERFSLLQLPLDREVPAPMMEATQSAAGRDYDVVSWQDSCPDDVVDQYGHLCQRMSVDVPMGEMESEAEEWSAARVRTAEARLRGQGGRSLVAVVRDVTTGQLVGNTVLEYFPDRPEVVYQENTLVLHPHRGHRLGMLLKVANLLRLQELCPQARRLYTWNAAENSHMLGINIELGFVARGYVGAWQKKLSARQSS
ncbi:GNAT family N-acetyltransferase [Arthrobacter castelli]|uniref:GNAT family N-acetyltransferase n=1 Tax=Arthrobacter castelli TaxID=271431 RepID=UPI000402A078|nr:GNAT family N-acetyltransferase [Arthrobacter castelli]